FPELFKDGLNRVPPDEISAIITVCFSDAREEQTEIVVDFGGRPDCRAWVPGSRFLFDRDRRADSLDQVDVGLVHPVQELAGVRGKALNEPPLPLGINRIERKAGLAGTADAREDDELV